jgi:RimJ/RimL family protein N-acetyltransferase
MVPAHTPGPAQDAGTDHPPTTDLAHDWPPFAIRIKVDLPLEPSADAPVDPLASATRPPVSLRPVRESDLPTLLDLLPDDVEHDPASEMFAELDLAANRRRILLQMYWRSAGTWSVDTWSLPFLVTHAKRPVGIQLLEAQHFRDLRVVDSWSWLVHAARRQGVGVAMRAGVLALAFDHLGAEAAVSSAREENGASLGVSLRLGYQDNGVSRSRSPSGPCTLRHMILSRATWEASAWQGRVEVRGLAECRPWFGI